MKQASIYSAGALLCLALTCCSNKAKADPEPATRTDTTATQAVAPDSVALEEPAAEPFGVRRVKVEKQNKFAEYEAEIDFPVAGPEAVQKAVTQALLKICGIEKPTAAAPKAQLIKDADNFLANAAKDAQELEESDFSAQYSFEADLELETANAKFITYKAATYVYLGGPHGNGLDRHFCFDAQTGERVSWKKVFKGGSAAQMSAMVKRELKRQAQLDSFNDFHLPEFVAFGDKGLYVEYDHYEIACYADGAPSCILPYSKISAHLTDYGRSLIP
ncbi:MAG: DUF4163 domain-containing protein [Alloprevotella sp.]|nr:DUF4163 domain-containing protein [Alloprevotella sp.]